MENEIQERSKGTSSVARGEVLIMNCQIDFINFINLQLFHVKFWFSENNIFRKHKRADAYRRASIVLNFKLIRENNDLLSLRHKQIFEVLHPVYKYAKMRISDKRYQNSTVRTF